MSENEMGFNPSPEQGEQKITNLSDLKQKTAKIERRMEESTQQHQNTISQGVTDLEKMRDLSRKNWQIIEELKIAINKYEDYKKLHELDAQTEEELAKLRSDYEETKEVEAKNQELIKATYDKPGVGDMIRDQADMENAGKAIKEIVEKYGPDLDKLGAEIMGLVYKMNKYQHKKYELINRIEARRQDLRVVIYDAMEKGLKKDEISDFKNQVDINLSEGENFAAYKQRMETLLGELGGFGNRRKRKVIKIILAFNKFDQALQAETEASNLVNPESERTILSQHYTETFDRAEKELAPKIKSGSELESLRRELEMRLWSYISKDKSYSYGDPVFSDIFNNLPHRK